MLYILITQVFLWYWVWFSDIWPTSHRDADAAHPTPPFQPLWKSLLLIFSVEVWFGRIWQSLGTLSHSLFLPGALHSGGLWTPSSCPAGAAGLPWLSCRLQTTRNCSSFQSQLSVTFLPWPGLAASLRLLYPQFTSLLWHLLHCSVTRKFISLSLSADSELLERGDMPNSFSSPSFPISVQLVFIGWLKVQPLP